MTKWHPATKFLLLGAIPLVGYLLWSGGDGSAPGVVASVDRPSPAEPSGDQPGPNPADVTFELPPLERFTAVVERPLFSPTRRMPVQVARDEAPPPEAAPSAGPTGPAEPDLRFFGTERRDGTAAALVTFPATNKVGRLAPGDMVGEWRVLSVDSNRLVLGRATSNVRSRFRRGRARHGPQARAAQRQTQAERDRPERPANLAADVPTRGADVPAGSAEGRHIAEGNPGPAQRYSAARLVRLGRERVAGQSASPDESASPDDASDCRRCDGAGWDRHAG